MIAFWKYDLYPYFLCGTIEEILDSGLVKIKEYGHQTFRPTFILPLEAGLKLKMQLEILEKDHLARMKEVKNESDAKLKILTEKFIP